MLVLIAVLLALIPAAAILYPFFRKPTVAYFSEDESARYNELPRRWEETLAGLRSTELEHSLGNLDEEDYDQLREQYMTEAALIMKAMDVEELEEREMLEKVKSEVERARRQAFGDGSRDVSASGSSDG